jgi:hypothetical protein
MSILLMFGRQSPGWAFVPNAARAHGNVPRERTLRRFGDHVMSGPVQRRGQDAGQDKPQAPHDDKREHAADKDKKAQDASNCADRTDGGRAIAVEDISSANDE